MSKILKLGLEFTIKRFDWLILAPTDSRSMFKLVLGPEAIEMKYVKIMNFVKLGFTNPRWWLRGELDCIGPNLFAVCWKFTPDRFGMRLATSAASAAMCTGAVRDALGRHRSG